MPSSCLDLFRFGSYNLITILIRDAAMNSLEWHKRHAIQIVAQLPEGREEALMVLECARELVADFLYPPTAVEKTELLSFPAPAGRRNGVKAAG